MEFLIMVVLFFVISSLFGGLAGRARSSSNNPSRGYSKTGTASSRPAQEPRNASPNRPAAPGNYRTTPGRSSNTAWEKGNLNRSNNSPLRKSTFNNHDESAGYLRDEIKEAKMLWDLNKKRMKTVNDDFNRFIEQQHREQQKMMHDTRALDR